MVEPWNRKLEAVDAPRHVPRNLPPMPPEDGVWPHQAGHHDGLQQNAGLSSVACCGSPSEHFSNPSALGAIRNALSPAVLQIRTYPKGKERFDDLALRI